MYQALYRKWRPSDFDQVYGQQQIVSVLKNEVSSGRISHAYLFCGTRGTGKTTCAKILAKAVNCLSPKDGNPCNECELCRGIDDGSILDIAEIDAASNNGIDNVRDIRDEVVYSPVRGKYRVYIIDEVHMMSGPAFNALLKTLEEPPSHVIFILATTEAAKVPPTILSRCQRFDFKRIPREEGLKRLNAICSGEKIAIEPDAAELIVRLSDGSLRDMISLLDQCAGTGEAITEKMVSELCGLSSRINVISLAQLCSEGDFEQAVHKLDQFHKDGRDMVSLCEQLLTCFRDAMLIKALRDPQSALSCSNEEYEALKAISENSTLEKILLQIETLSDTLNRMQFVTFKRTELEMSLLALCRPRLLKNEGSLSARIAELEKKISSMSGTPIPQAPKEQQASEKAPRKEARQPDVREAQPAPQTAPAADNSANEETELKKFLSKAKSELPANIAPLFSRVTPSLSGDTLTLTVTNDLDKNILGRDGELAILSGIFSNAAGRKLTIRVSKAAPASDPFEALSAKIMNRPN